jgi:hypothetical protein
MGVGDKWVYMWQYIPQANYSIEIKMSGCGAPVEVDFQFEGGS